MRSQQRLSRGIPISSIDRRPVRATHSRLPAGDLASQLANSGRCRRHPTHQNDGTLHISRGQLGRQGIDLIARASTNWTDTPERQQVRVIVLAREDTISGWPWYSFRSISSKEKAIFDSTLMGCNMRASLLQQHTDGDIPYDIDILLKIDRLQSKPSLNFQPSLICILEQTGNKRSASLDNKPSLIYFIEQTGLKDACL